MVFLSEAVAPVVGVVAVGVLLPALDEVAAVVPAHEVV